MNISGGNFNEDVESVDNSTVNISGGTFQTAPLTVPTLKRAEAALSTSSAGRSALAKRMVPGYIGAIENGHHQYLRRRHFRSAGRPATEGNGKINVYDFSGGQPAAINTVGGGAISFFDGPLTNLVANDPGVRLLGTDGSLASIVAEDSSVITHLRQRLQGIQWRGKPAVRTTFVCVRQLDRRAFRRHSDYQRVVQSQSARRRHARSDCPRPGRSPSQRLLALALLALVGAVLVVVGSESTSCAFRRNGKELMDMKT